MRSPRAKVEVTRADILRLSADSGLDPRTTKRAIDRGIDTLRAEVDRVRIREAAKKLGLTIE
jgi:hypothetical protein